MPVLLCQGLCRSCPHSFPSPLFLMSAQVCLASCVCMCLSTAVDAPHCSIPYNLAKFLNSPGKLLLHVCWYVLTTLSSMCTGACMSCRPYGSSRPFSIYIQKCIWLCSYPISLFHLAHCHLQQVEKSILPVQVPEHALGAVVSNAKTVCTALNPKP